MYISARRRDNVCLPGNQIVIVTGVLLGYFEKMPSVRVKPIAMHCKRIKNFNLFLPLYGLAWNRRDDHSECTVGSGKRFPFLPSGLLRMALKINRKPREINARRQYNRLSGLFYSDCDYGRNNA